MKKIMLVLAAALFTFTGCMVKDEVYKGPTSIDKVAFEPAAPTSITPVTVTATVSGLQKVTKATLTYNGTDVEMTGNGTTYTGTIPAQADGTEVKFKVTVVNEAELTTVSEEYTYKVGDPATDWTKLKLNEVYGAGADDEKFFELSGDQMILDGPQRKGDLRRSRAGAQNIVPNSTGAAKAIGLVIPELNGKLIGSAQRVPTATGSTTILVAVVDKAVTVDEINAAMKAAQTESFGYNSDEIVSSDVIGMKYGSLFDATQTMVIPMGNKTQVQVVSWYDNENSYTSQMVRTIKYFSKLLNK